MIIDNSTDNSNRNTEIHNNSKHYNYNYSYLKAVNSNLLPRCNSIKTQDTALEARASPDKCQALVRTLAQRTLRQDRQCLHAPCKLSSTPLRLLLVSIALNALFLGALDQFVLLRDLLVTSLHLILSIIFRHLHTFSGRGVPDTSKLVCRCFLDLQLLVVGVLFLEDLHHLVLLRDLPASTSCSRRFSAIFIPSVFAESLSPMNSSASFFSLSSSPYWTSCPLETSITCFWRNLLREPPPSQDHGHVATR